MAARELSAEEAREYLLRVRDLELSCYRLDRLVSELKKLQKRDSDLLKDTEKSADEDEQPVRKPVIWSVFGFEAIISLICGAGMGAISGVILFYVTSFVMDPELSLLTPVILLAVIGGLVAYVNVVIPDIRIEKEEYEQGLKEYNGRVQDRNREISCYTDSVKTLTDLAVQGQETLEETKKLLSDYYDLGCIYPEYRDLVPVSRIIEYLDSGRCTSLSGEDGAYSLYEKELSENRISGTLEDVMESVGEAARNQRTLSDAISESNRQVSALTSCVDGLKDTRMLTAYYTRTAAENARCRAEMEDNRAQMHPI